MKIAVEDHATVVPLPSLGYFIIKGIDKAEARLRCQRLDLPYPRHGFTPHHTSPHQCTCAAASAQSFSP